MPKVHVDCGPLRYHHIYWRKGLETRPLKEGEAVFKAGHIMSCGWDESKESHLKSLCLKTSALVELPHEIDISLAERPWKCQCTCKAGLSGLCKHIIATLIYVNRNENLEVLSCTDWTQTWGKEKKSIQEVYSPKPFSEFCHPKIKRKLEFYVTKSVDKMNFELLSLGVGDSALSKFIGNSMETERSLEEEPVDSTLERRHTYYGQVQLGMALLNLPKTHLIIFSSFSKSYLDIVVDFDRAFAEDLIKNISQKYFTCMLHYYCLNKL